MIGRVLATIVAAVIGGSAGGFMTIAAWFIAAQGESDPSTGGAYVAMAMLTCPIGFAFGAIAAGAYVWSAAK